MNHSNNYYYVRCQNCHQEIRSGSKFCPYCGAKQQIQSQQAKIQSNSKSKARNKPFLSDKTCEILCTPCGFIIFLITVYFLFKIGITFIIYEYSTPLFIWESLKYLIPLALLLCGYLYIMNRSKRYEEAHRPKVTYSNVSNINSINPNKVANNEKEQRRQRIIQDQQAKRKRDYWNKHIYKADTPFSIPMWHAKKQEHHGWHEHGMF